MQLWLCGRSGAHKVKAMAASVAALVQRAFSPADSSSNSLCDAAAPPPAQDLAASTAALVLLAGAAARATALQRLKLTLAFENSSNPQHLFNEGLMARASALVGRVTHALTDMLAANGVLRCVPGSQGRSGYTILAAMMCGPAVFTGPGHHSS